MQPTAHRSARIIGASVPPAASGGDARNRAARPQPVLPLLLCALVISLALLSFYAQVLGHPSAHGELLRPVRHAAAVATADRGGSSPQAPAGRDPSAQR